MTIQSEHGGVLMTGLVLGLLLSVLGGVAMNFALSDAEMAHHQRKESSARLLAESGVGQVTAWLNHGMLQGRVLPAASGCQKMETAPDVVYDATRPEDDLLLNDPKAGIFRRLGDIGRIEQIQLYASVRPEGFCTVTVTAQSNDRVRRSVSLEFGSPKVPPLQSAIHAGPSPNLSSSSTPMWGHWGAVRIAGDVHLRQHDRFPRKWTSAPITGLSYVESGATFEDPWTEVWIGGAVHSDDPDFQLPASAYPHHDPIPGLPADPWQYQKFKQLAMKFGRYYVPDAAGQLYRDGIMDLAKAQTVAQVLEDNSVPKGLVFVDTLDQKPPSPENVATLVIHSSNLEGILFLNAHVVFNPESKGKTVPAWSPPTDSQVLATRVATTLSDINFQGVLHTTGRLQVDRPVRVFGSVVAEQGVTGDGLLEVWYDYDAARGLFRGLPVVYPLSGTWREWGS